MARIRTIKPEIWMSAQVMNLEHSSRLLFLGLITQADDEGRGSADPRRLKASIFGGDDVTSADVRRWLDEISKQGLCVIYNDEKHGLLYALPSWSQHQSIDRPRQSAYPAPPSVPDAQRALDEPASTTRRGPDRTVPEGTDRKDLSTGPDLTVPEDKKPPTPLERGQGAHMRASRRPRDVRAASNLAWGGVTEGAAKHYRREQLEGADPTLAEAVRQLGGWNRFGKSTAIGTLKAPFREAYETILEGEHSELREAAS